MKLVTTTVVLPSSSDYRKLVTSLIDTGIPHKSEFMPPQGNHYVIIISSSSKLAESVVDNLLGHLGFVGTKEKHTAPNSVTLRPLWTREGQK